LIQLYGTEIVHEVRLISLTFNRAMKAIGKWRNKNSLYIQGLEAKRTRLADSFDWFER